MSQPPPCISWSSPLTLRCPHEGCSGDGVGGHTADMSQPPPCLSWSSPLTLRCPHEGCSGDGVGGHTADMSQPPPCLSWSSPLTLRCSHEGCSGDGVEVKRQTWPTHRHQRVCIITARVSIPVLFQGSLLEMVLDQ